MILPFIFLFLIVFLIGLVFVFGGIYNEDYATVGFGLVIIILGLVLLILPSPTHQVEVGCSYFTQLKTKDRIIVQCNDRTFEFQDIPTYNGYPYKSGAMVEEITEDKEIRNAQLRLTK